MSDKLVPTIDTSSGIEVGFLVRDAGVLAFVLDAIPCVPIPAFSLNSRFVGMSRDMPIRSLETVR
jgi:hypothetical protein